MNIISNIFFDLYGVLIDYRFGKIQELPPVDILTKLNKKYSLWIISNTSNQNIEDFKNQFKFIKLFKGIITSESAQYSKPDYRIFNYALDIAQTNSYSSIFIDDSLSNIKSAKRLGFKTLHYTNKDIMKLLLEIENE